MKLYISADIEGVCGVTTMNETRIGTPEFSQCALQMTKEVNACIKGAFKAGFSEGVVKDSHGAATNIIMDDLDERAQFIKGWSGTPELMVYGLDESYDAIAFLGYHCAASMQGNPLAHTLSSSKFSKVTLNDELFSEFTLGAYTAAYYQVPSVFVSGDQTQCDEAKRLIPEIATVAVKDGLGAATVNISTKRAVIAIEEQIKDVLLTDYQSLIPEHFNLEVTYQKAVDAIKMSNYPNAKLKSDLVVQYQTTDFYEIMRFFLFA